MLAGPASAADVTPQRLVNADKEPQNWLMNHRTYDGQRYSPLARIDKDNVKGLKLAYTVALGGTAGNEYVMATPLAEDGFLYITELRGACSTRSTAPPAMSAASSGAWTPEQAAPAAQPRRRAVGQSRHHRRRRPATHRRDRQGYRQGGVGNRRSPRRPTWRSPRRPLAVKDKIIVGAAGGDTGVRDWMAGLDAATGKLLWRKFTVPGARRARQRDLEGQEQRLADRRRRDVGDRHL